MTDPTELHPSEPAGAPTSLPKPTLRSALRLLLGIAGAVALLGWVLPRVTDTTWSAIVDVLRTVPGLALAACFGLTLAFLVSYALTLRASLPGLTIPRALIVNTAGTAISKLFPGGGAVGLAATFLICRSWGFSLRAISTSAIVTGVWNTMTRVALPVLGIGLLVLSDSPLPSVLRQAGIGAAISGSLVLALFVGIIASSAVADTVGRGVDRVAGRWLNKGGRTGRAQAAMSDTRARIIDTVRRAWLQLTLGMVGFFAAQLGIFLIALHVTGIDLAFASAFAAFAIGRLLTAVGITPGGLGITETGTAAALVALGADPALSAAAVVLMSIFTNLVELPFGVLAWVAWSVDPGARLGAVRAAPEQPDAGHPDAERLYAEQADAGQPHAEPRGAESPAAESPAAEKKRTAEPDAQESGPSNRRI